jgi:hypothetical protein
MLSEQEFYHKWRRYFKRNHKYGAHYPDDYEGDVMMLFVVDDIPSAVRTHALHLISPFPFAFSSSNAKRLASKDSE